MARRCVTRSQPFIDRFSLNVASVEIENEVPEASVTQPFLHDLQCGALLGNEQNPLTASNKCGN
jgi:hypothetical protein